MRVKTSYCIDLSGSMSTKQILTALDRVSISWKHGDLIFIFDHSSAESLSFDELVNYALQIDDIKELAMRLFKKGSKHKWRGSGAAKAAMLAPSHSIKVCLTDGFLTGEALNSYKKIIKL